MMTLPLLIVLGTLTYLVARAIGQLWLDYRVKMVLLEKLEGRPELLRSFQELQELLEDTSSDPDIEQRHDFTLTGMMLAVIGAACVILYGTVGGGRFAVGAYWGGVGCVAVGFMLVLLGLLIRFLSRVPDRPHKDL